MSERRCTYCDSALTRRANEDLSKFHKRKLCSQSCVVLYSAQRRRLPVDESRVCRACGKPLAIRPNERPASFAQRQTCGAACGSALSKKSRSLREPGALVLETKPCSVCGSIITRVPRIDTPSRFALRHTCGSLVCLAEHRRRRCFGSQVDRQCVVCGTVLEKRSKENEYHFRKRTTCSLNCLISRQKSKHPRRAEIKYCKWCGNQFERLTKERRWVFRFRVTCSKACRSLLIGELSRRPANPKNCIECGATFVRRRNEPPSVFRNRKTCGQACQFSLCSQRMRGNTRLGDLQQDRGRTRRQLAEPKYCVSCGVQFSIRETEGWQQFRIRRTCGDRDCIISAFKRSFRAGARPTKVYPPEFNEELKRRIRDRDRNRCRRCGESRGRSELSVHHIDYNKSNCAEWNLVTLCICCHIRSNSNRSYWNAIYTAMMLEDIAA